MKINKYPDGTSYVNIRDQVFSNFTFKINSYEDLWHLGQIIDAANHNGVSPTVEIPNLIDAQADKRFDKHESSGLKLVCEFLNRMNANFKIFHPHNPEVVEALMDNVEIIDNSYFIKEVLSEIYCEQANIQRDKGVFYHVNHDLSNLILISSDAGGFKPLMKLCDKLNWKGLTGSAVKSRKYENGKSTIIQEVMGEDFEGKDILIVDDICVYGGTFKGLAKMLRERNCGKLYLAISHMTIQDLGEDPITKYFDKVFTTNSKFNNYYTDNNMGKSNKQPSNLKIIKMFNYE